ncbi:btaf1 RNA polymerase II [Ordospora colligata]|uniref:Snf2-like DNA/RNA helicase n=1 Tax=Ordospora colligata OC4 TaxID=1354746 RepID=A0A0B2UL55_9MICR|nr:Snf2-like DNA/RNA helicase [Ordospora colligata OC4]KHN70034.1 Snf2-like DNA/RNA helicase [Ordospora colligata OC4]TBU16416.1 Snf2-like DNA/RNA helicase [Ordospora colligata]TBU16601.1 Snf2-like DNA/RNA helicase [Ordospora colligata]
MNRLEKFFTTLYTAQSKVLKRYTTDELVSQIKEYVDFTPYILRQTYKLLCGQEGDDRKNGARILGSLMFQFKLVTEFKIEYMEGKDVYLSCTGEQFNVQAPSIQEQKKIVKKLADMEHVESNFLSDIDFKASAGEAIKRHKVEEKAIENPFDFFEQVSENLLSYEWHKRHGAFLAFEAMFSQMGDGEMQVKIDPKLFSKIYEILVTDKFNDFVDDRTFAPVRDAAARLLACIYPLIGVNDITEQLIGFLDNEDWQVQFSGLIALGYLKAYVPDKEMLCRKLVSLLCSVDEDIKLLSAELLCGFPICSDAEVILERCWSNIEAEEVISVSKTSNLSLLAKIYRENPGMEVPADKLKEIFPCFTSPVPDVRVSIVKMVENFSDESIDFLIAEMILIEEKEEIRELAMSVLKKRSAIRNNLVVHFMNILGGSLYEPYREDDFVSYDDLYFTKSGINVIGKDEILKNRCFLFECLMGGDTKDLKCKETMIGNTFLFLSRFTHRFSENNEGLKCSNTAEQMTDDEILVKDLDEYFLKCRDLKMAPVKEFKKKVSDPSITSIHLMVESLYVDYIRMQASVNLPEMRFAFKMYKVETCKQFLSLFSRIVTDAYDQGRICVDEFLMRAYEGLVQGSEGFLVFFKAFGARLLEHAFFNRVTEFEDRLDFFAKTIEIYACDEGIRVLEGVFEDALHKKNVAVVRGFMKSLEFNERFVRSMLDNLDVELLDMLIESGDHSFNPLFVKPLLNNISSGKDRNVSCKVFSKIIPTLGFRTNEKISEDLLVKIKIENKALESLLDSTKIPEYIIRCPMETKLRDYQIEGVRWLSFLYSFNLNGILADDMGLGKTLQVLTFLCSEMYETDRRVLVICPSSLTGHWKSEVKRFFPFMSCEIYKKEMKNDCAIVVSSYEAFRNDHMNFVEKDWFYVVVDEGHVLRNKQTMLYTRMNMIKCARKIILTGTPVHNSVEDLVSLFNFLMPNYIGSEKDYGTLSVKMSDSEIEKAHAKLEYLHKKVLPFVLRRLKIDVLKDLPPKIIRDIIIEFGPTQESLYKEIDENGGREDTARISELEYGKVDQKNVGFKRTRDLFLAISHIGHFRDFEEVSCKVRALDDIISLCGGEELRSKILVFFQFKSSIDLVVNDIMKKYKFKHSRIDGSVVSSARTKIIEEFNNGATQVLFLTTQIGGLGLNLTAADTVVMYEHDWNPFNDLQAMDRAHRIGQKRTVNVFRLIVKNTLEEKVMNLQSFKMFIANSLISQQNADIETMETKDLLEKFRG